MRTFLGFMLVIGALVIGVCAVETAWTFIQISSKHPALPDATLSNAFNTYLAGTFIFLILEVLLGLVFASTKKGRG